MSDWHDMSTVPKDGTKVDGWLVNRLTGAGSRMTNVWWDTEMEEWRHGAASFDWPVEAPVSVETGLPVVVLSYWMPLPEPPKPPAMSSAPHPER